MKKTLIMGILNITPDSFSDGGEFFNRQKAIQHAEEMVKEGADIIDIGGESTRPFSKRIPADEELKRVLPVLKEVKRLNVQISIDTYKSVVAENCLKNGANIINDISALRMDEKMADIIAKYNCKVVLMHMKGTPENMQLNPAYKNVIKEISEFFEERIEFALKKGIKKENIILDTGIGFGKTVRHNIEILRNLKEFKKFNLPILVGTSRKSFIGKILNKDEKNRLEGTLATTVIAIMNGADIIRVHDVKENVLVAKLVDEIYPR